MINVYIFDYTNEIKEKNIDRFLTILPLERINKACKYKNIKHKNLCIISYLLLKYAINIEYNINDNFNFIYGKYEKPFLKNYPQIFFNISHCDTGACCVVSNKEVGVDIQDIQYYDNNLTKIVCCDEELLLLENSLNKEELFYKMWTIKESYIKADGQGLNLNLKDINTCSNINLCSKYKNMLISVCYNDKKTIIFEKNLNFNIVKLQNFDMFLK
ncbi:MAG: 4'-phosphopantetheinyl transferase family protein [Clostridium sp.]